MTVAELEKILARIQDKDTRIVIYDQVMEGDTGHIVEPEHTDLFDGSYLGGGFYTTIPRAGEPCRILLLH